MFVRHITGLLPMREARRIITVLTRPHRYRLHGPSGQTRSIAKAAGQEQRSVKTVAYPASTAWSARWADEPPSGKHYIECDKMRGVSLQLKSFV
jgi:hypothetical protein